MWKGICYGRQKKLEKTIEERDLGVMISSNSIVLKHCIKAVQKGNQTGTNKNKYHMQTKEVIIGLHKSLRTGLEASFGEGYIVAGKGAKKSNADGRGVYRGVIRKKT